VIGSAALFVVGGCAPALSTFQPAHVAPQGHFQGGAGFEIGVPVGTLDDLITVGRNLADKAQTNQGLTDDEKWRLFDVGINLALNPPSVGPHVGIAYTVVEHLELNLRYAGAVIRFGGRYQLLDHVTGPFDMVTGFGVAHDSHGVSVPEIDIVRVDEFSRWRIDVPLLIGTSRDWFRVWAGPRFLYSWFDAGLSLNLQNEHPQVNLTGTAVYFGGQAGVALGYRKLFFAVELTMAEVWGTAHLTTNAITPGVHDSSLSTFVVYPSIGLIAEL
jgi:hypothetical protein